MKKIERQPDYRGGVRRENGGGVWYVPGDRSPPPTPPYFLFFLPLLFLSLLSSGYEYALVYEVSADFFKFLNLSLRYGN